MEKYSQFTVEDFVQDPYFREWILKNPVETNRFWEIYCNNHPEKKYQIEQAKSMINALQIKEIAIGEADIKRGIDRILALTLQEDIQEVTPIVLFYKSTWFRVAASLALLISIGLWWMNNEGVLMNMHKNAVYTEGGGIEQKIDNLENTPLTIRLPDGTTVILEKNSELRYEKSFSGSVREVHLKGEALFDVVKNPNKPFIVYAGNLVTKVLGTSFRIKAIEKETDITVNVIRGRVSVFADKKDQQKDPETDGMLLTANQKVVFEKTEERLKRTLIEKPVVVVSPETLQQFVFDEAPISTIFKAVEEAYGVEIVFDEETLKNCALTTTLKNETLFEKLAIICKSIGATYKVVDAQVVIQGEACQ